MELKTILALKDAETIVDAAIGVGRSHDMLPLRVIVLDVGGHTLVMKREDGSGVMRCDVATGKAWGALGMGGLPGCWGTDW